MGRVPDRFCSHYKNVRPRANTVKSVFSLCLLGSDHLRTANVSAFSSRLLMSVNALPRKFLTFVLRSDGHLFPAAFVIFDEVFPAHNSGSQGARRAVVC